MFSPPQADVRLPTLHPPEPSLEPAGVAHDPQPSAWPAWMFPGLARLAERPLALVLVALALNALVRPYLGFDHDTRLYALQALERVHPGTFADDLYLRYGSQDRYSAFGMLVTPLAAAFGATAAFFLLYLASKALFFWAALRIIRVLSREPEAVALSMLFLATAAVPFGGNEIFSVNESFLTPRLVASALVLFGLERSLAGRQAAAFGLLVLSFLLHPIMALGGILVWGIALLSRHLSLKSLAVFAVLAVGAGIGAVAWEPLGSRLFGHVDEEWRDIIFRTCFFIRPSVWATTDWLRIGCGIAIAVCAAVRCRNGERQLIGAALAAAVLGFVGTVVAVQSHYLLLIQASPYRAMWVLEFLVIPLGIALAFDLIRNGKGAVSCAGVALLLLATTDWTTHGLVWMTGYAAAFLVLLVFFRGLSTVPNRPDWLCVSTRGSVVVGFLVLCLLTLVTVIVLCFLQSDPALELELHPLVLLRNAPETMHKLPLIVLTCYAVSLSASLATGRRLGIAAAAVFIGYQALLVGLESSAAYGRRFSELHRRTEFVASYLDTGARGRSVTLYWPGDLRTIWFDLRARSYFNAMQLSGCAFNRGTAIEGRRRSQLVRRFAAVPIRRSPPRETWWRDSLENFYDLAPDEPPPTREDLIRLCADPELDVVVLEQGFDGLYSATNGKVFIYDCEQVRRLGLSARVAQERD